MKTHPKAIGSALAGLLLATTFAGASARAEVPVPPCVQSCQQTRQACGLQCVAENECGLVYRAGHAACIASTLPRTPARKSCVQECNGQLKACRADLKTCKTSCGTDFQSCREDCGMGG
jgi:hypothetical protein